MNGVLQGKSWILAGCILLCAWSARGQAKILLEERGGAKWVERYEITEAQAAALPVWSPYSQAPIPLAVGKALELVRKKIVQEPAPPQIKDIMLAHGSSDEAENIWFYEIYATEEDKSRHIWNDCHILVLMDGTVLLETRSFL